MPFNVVNSTALPLPFFSADGVGFDCVVRWWDDPAWGGISCLVVSRFPTNLMLGTLPCEASPFEEVAAADAAAVGAGGAELFDAAAGGAAGWAASAGAFVEVASTSISYNGVPTITCDEGYKGTP
jgi:hypothetical protein